MLSDRHGGPPNLPLSAGEGARLARPSAAYLERCVRHLIYRDLEHSSGNAQPSAAAKRLLLMPEHQDIDPADVVLGAEGVGLDSLGMITAASAVSRFFGLGTSGTDDYLIFEPTVGGWAKLVEKHLDLRGNNAEFVFETSGSTNTPSRVAKDLAAVTEEVDALFSTVVPPGIGRIVALVPPQHIFGTIFTVFLPAALGLPVVDGTNRGPGSILASLNAGDLIVGTPFNWELLASQGPALPEGVCGVTSGAPMPDEAWEKLKRAGLSWLTEVFGSTETGGIGWRQSHAEPFALLSHCVRDGEAVLRSSNHERLILQDNLEWEDARRFRPAGRIDRAVQIAGVNVSLEKVRKTLLNCPGVFRAAVRPDRQRLKAFIVPADTGEAPDQFAERLHAHARNHLDAVARPASYTFGKEVPRNVMGKPADW